jgi:hypothetical protein
VDPSQRIPLLPVASTNVFSGESDARESSEYC